MKYLHWIAFFSVLFPVTSFAQTEPPCGKPETECLKTQIESLANEIHEDKWRDQVYRELAKALAAEKRAMEAIPYIDKIINPDTKALTIRGIGMEAATASHVSNQLFMKLREAAEKITDPPSYGIALTYIAMAQALADDDAGANKTSSEMKNEDLRNKAYGETAEIQAEKNKFDIALKTITYIDTVSFKNKAYKNVSRIFSENEKYQEAYDAAQYITNPVMHAEALQFILDTQRIKREKQDAQQQ